MSAINSFGSELSSMPDGQGDGLPPVDPALTRSSSISIESQNRTSSISSNSDGQRNQVVSGSYEQMDRARERDLQRRTRWSYLLTFSREVDELVSRVFRGYSRESCMWTAARNGALDNFRTWKCKTLGYMKEHVRREKELDKASHSGCGMYNCTDEEGIFQHFFQGFTSDKFRQVFYWTGPILDYERSDSIGQWYIKQIYANLATQVKLWDDLVERDEDRRIQVGAWDEVIDFWDHMASAEQYSGVGQGNFAELVTRRKPEKKRKSDSEVKEAVKKKICFVPIPGQTGSVAL